MTITPAAKNAMLATLNVTKVSLHTADPGADGGTAELTVTRGDVVFAAPVNGRLTLSADVTILVNDPTTITHVGYWAGNTFVLSQALSVPQVITNPSNFILQATNTYIEI